MTKAIFAAATALGAIAIAAPAAAQEAPSGPRVELQFGYEEDRVDFGDGSSFENGGFYSGVGVGYDISLGRVAIGLDLEAGQSNVEDEVFFQENGADVFATIENDRDLYVGARLTVPVGPVDLYAKGGYSNVRTVVDIETDDGTTITREIIEDEDDGFRVGAGGRYYFGRGTYFGAEYRYSDYDNIDTNKHQFVGTVGITF